MMARDFFIRPVALIALSAAGAIHVTQPALGQTAVKFSLDWKYEGTQAPFVVALDKGYFRVEGLDVTIDTGNVPEAINLAAETYDMAFTDINLLIKFRDQNPQFRIKTIFMTYNKPAYAIVSRKSRGVTIPKDLEGKRLGAKTADSAFAQWPRCWSRGTLTPLRVFHSQVISTSSTAAYRAMISWSS
jgi:NitT/TauT family transport system substrate-binding protein